MKHAALRKIINTEKDVFAIKNSRKIYLILCVVCVICLALFMFWKQEKKYVDIYNVVKESFITDRGYSNELSKHISKKIFNQINIYNTYAVDDKKYKKPFKVNFKLKENSQSKVDNKVYVKMTYSVDIKDSKNAEVGGSWNVPITFTVKNADGAWYIIYKYEEP